MDNAGSQIPNVAVDQTDDTGLADPHPATERHLHTRGLTGIHQ
jgi:hypothetical protein